MAFVHLHVHSQFSLLDGTMKPAEVAKAASAAGMPAVALTDTANLFGGVEFYKQAEKAGVRPILGAVLHVQPEGVRELDARREGGGFKVVALVLDDEGYVNLCKLITHGIFEGMHFKPRVALDVLEAHQQGLVLLTGGRRGAFGDLLRAGDRQGARARMADLARRFPPHTLYLELVDHGLPGDEPCNEGARELAAEFGHHTVVTNAVHYAQPVDAAVHDVLHGIAAGASMGSTDRPRTDTDQAWFKTEAELRALFPHDGEALDRTVEIAERVRFQFTFYDYKFPATTPPDVAADRGLHEQPDTDANWAYFYRAFPPPKDFELPDPEQAIPPRPEGAGHLAGYFEWYSRQGLALRLQYIEPELHPAYHERLEVELRIIEDMGFPAYMLIVAEFINWSKDVDIPIGPGRGSAAGSLVAYAMRITDIDPIRFGLLFERFLNPERNSMPDIDVDFCQDRREEAIEHVRDKYGAPLVSQIITYGTLKAKAAIRDVARVLDLRHPDADRIAKLVPDTLGITLREALEEVEVLERMRKLDPTTRRVLAIAQRVEGVCRQTGVHAAGVVIADKPLVEYAPLYRDGEEGGPVVQYDMASAESVGLIKFDFLGLKTLDQIRDAVALVERNHGVQVDMSMLPLDDARTYELLSKGDALGVFQLESSGMRDLLTRLKPNCVDDMVALVALYRPGPLQTGMTEEFVERKHGRIEVSYPVPELEPVLKGTYGTIIYQEQVMQIAQIMAGFSLGQADLLRRAMGKKKLSVMNEMRGKFVDGAVERGFEQKTADDIFDNLAKFAAYGFNKSHSAAYGYVSYQTAWLKAHYRPEYMAALMTVESANTDKVLTYIEDCRAAGIRVESACVNQSMVEFHVPPANQRPHGDVIRFGLSAVKNIGGSAVRAIIEERERGGLYADAFDFFRRIDHRRVNRRAIENLVKAGAFDTFGISRAGLLEGLGDAIQSAQRHQADAAAGQGSLFAAAPTVSQSLRFRWPDTPEWPLSVKLSHEREVLGLFLTGHPMEVFRRDVHRFASKPLGALRELEHGQEVRVVGLPGEIRPYRTKRGDRMAFVKLEDVDAVVECVFFSSAWASSQRVVDGSGPVLVTGTVELTGDAPKIKASSAERLSEVRGRSVREITFQLRAPELSPSAVERLVAVLRDHPGECPTRMVVELPGRFEAHLGLPKLRVDPGVALEETALSLFGRADAVVWS